ncbi:hypothetical protein QUF70_02135 [Desulfobacterales bacterium HSG17]|nr:hypothetical protein [Desulfobacterales bacterium HSG17]
MKSCSNYQETLFLDVYEEAEPKAQSEWNQHMESCPACVKDRTDLQRMIFDIKEAAPCADLLPEEARSLSFAIRQKLHKEQSIPKWRLWIQKGIQRGIKNTFVNPMPALTAACLILLVFGWFGTKGMENPWPMQTASNLSSEEKLLIKDFEVINNLDLLEEMDALEKLVQAVDKREYGSYLFKEKFFAQKENNLNEYKV